MSYSPKYIDHFTKPRNVGELEPNDGWSEVEHSGSGCFDRVKLTIHIADGRIQEAQYRARACSGTIAACSALSELVVGLTLAEAKALTPEDLDEDLGGTPERKRHSLELAIEALNKALES